MLVDGFRDGGKMRINRKCDAFRGLGHGRQSSLSRSRMVAFESMKSRFVTTLSVFAIIAGSVGLVSGSLQLFSYGALQREPDLAPLVVASFQEKFGMELTIEQVSSMLLRTGGSGLVVSILSIVIGVALKRRSRWARPASIYLILFLTLGMISSLLASGFRQEMPLFWAGAALTALAIFVHTGIILKLRSAAVRAEFEG